MDSATECRLVGWSPGPGCRGWGRVWGMAYCAVKNRSRSLGSAEERFARDDTALSQRGRLAGPYFVFEIFAGGFVRGLLLPGLKAEKGRSRSLGSAEERFARDDTALS